MPEPGGKWDTRYMSLPFSPARLQGHQVR